MPPERKKSPPRAVKPTGKPAPRVMSKTTERRPPANALSSKPRESAPAAAPARAAAARPVARPAARPTSRPPEKRQDEAKLKKANDRTIEKARRDAAARHAKMLTAHANRKITSQGRTAPVPTLDEFTVAFVQDRLRKSQARKQRQGDVKPAKPTRPGK